MGPNFLHCYLRCSSWLMGPIKGGKDLETPHILQITHTYMGAVPKNL